MAQAFQGFFVTPDQAPDFKYSTKTCTFVTNMS